MKNNIYDKESHVKPSDDTGPKAAEGADLDNEELELTSQNEIFSKNTKNLNRENINISKSQTMNTDKDNIFDKLYSSIMESDDFPPMDDAPFGDDDGGFDDPMGGDELGAALRFPILFATGDGHDALDLAIADERHFHGAEVGLQHHRITGAKRGGDVGAVPTARALH